MDGKDTLALLPTGGGKSICYQIPGLAMEGICLVISPLIALMEDQIAHLKSKNIRAIAINSSMSKRQIDIALDNAIYGDIKFLYVSPERLKTHLFKARFAKMNVNLIAIDEAHCISQWGYDFRPSYLEIEALREIHPKTPFLALTATATKEVVIDIQEKLAFKTRHVIRKSFERKNLTYNTFLTNNKVNRIEHFIQQNKGCGIIYCSTRRKVKTVYLKLHEKGYSVDYYHAGLTFEERKKKQDDWFNNRTQIIISTNAFGMGIDKPDVRFVLHHDAPYSLEAYFQEAGRAGRDGNPAVSYLFYEAQDIQELKQSIDLKFPPIETIKRIYTTLGNHFQLAIGSGKDESYPINLAEFSDKYNLNLILVYNSLKFLELCGFIQLSDNYKQPSKMRVIGNNHDLYNYQVKDKDLNKIIQFILRTEMNVYEDYVNLNELKITKATGLPINVIHEKLQLLNQQELIDFIPKSDLPSVTYTTERLMDNNLSISTKFYLARKTVGESQIAAIVDFLTTKNCKSEQLLQYFGEEDTVKCGKCSSCIESKETTQKPIHSIIRKTIQAQYTIDHPIAIIDLLTALKEYEEEEILNALRQLVDHNEIVMDNLGKSFKVNHA